MAKSIYMSQIQWSKIGKECDIKEFVVDGEMVRSVAILRYLVRRKPFQV